MSSVLFFMHSLWRVFPVRFRSHPAAQRIRRMFKVPLLAHDDIYSAAYYAREVDPDAVRAAPVIAASVLAEFSPKNVIDVGCGTGALIKVLKDRGCTCRGLEYADAALAVCRERGLDVRKFDIEQDTLEAMRDTYDLAISTEVAEHLPERCAGRFVALLASLAPAIVFTAAPPGQGGRDHINEQPREYWVALFEGRGFAFDKALSDKWRSHWNRRQVAYFYRRNIMVFRRTRSA